MNTDVRGDHHALALELVDQNTRVRLASQLDQSRQVQESMCVESTGGFNLQGVTAVFVPSK